MWYTNYRMEKREKMTYFYCVLYSVRTNRYVGEGSFEAHNLKDAITYSAFRINRKRTPTQDRVYCGSARAE